MDENEQAEQGTGPADAEMPSFEEAEQALTELAEKYRGQDFNAVEEADRDTMTKCWHVQQKAWFETQELVVNLMNDINRYVALRYRGVPDVLVAAAVSAAGEHLSNIASCTEYDRQTKNTEMLELLADGLMKARLAMAKPGGNG